MKKNMKKNKFFLKLILLILLIFIVFVQINLEFDFGDFNFDFSAPLYEENLSFEPKLSFCPYEDCYGLYRDSLINAKLDVKCALYDLSLENLSIIFLDLKNRGIDLKLVIDGDYEKREAYNILKDAGVDIISDGKKSTYMHNKFCIIDGKKLVVGSANPTLNGFFKNNNNIFSFDSFLLASIYEEEFNNLYGGKFSNAKKINSLNRNNLKLYYADEIYEMDVYFCPKDDCEKAIIDALNLAQDEILFANFVLTLDSVENILIEKFNLGLTVNGLIESRNKNSMGSITDDLKKIFDLRYDTNPNSMHHKYFIVDNEIVITGSMNPSNSGVGRNDENLIIIKNKNIAKKFKSDFEMMFGK